MALIGHINNYSCRYIDKRKQVSVVIQKEKILSVPIRLRESNLTVNAVVSFQCPHQGQIIAASEKGKSYEVVLETLQEYMLNLRMPLIVLTGNSSCDILNKNNYYELSYYHSPSVKFMTIIPVQNTNVNNLLWSDDKKSD